jgi:hypothetical protein
MEQSVKAEAAATQGTAEVSDLHTKLLREGGVTLLLALMDGAATARALSVRCGLTLAKVNFLLAQMIQAQLVRHVPKEQVGYAAEQHYALVSDDVHLKVGKDTPLSERVQLTHLLFNRFREGISRCVTGETTGNRHLSFVVGHIAPERIANFVARLDELRREFEEANTPGERHLFSLGLLLYPSEPGSES